MCVVGLERIWLLWILSGERTYVSANKWKLFGLVSSWFIRTIFTLLSETVSLLPFSAFLVHIQQGDSSFTSVGLLDCACNKEHIAFPSSSLVSFTSSKDHTTDNINHRCHKQGEVQKRFSPTPEVKKAFSCKWGWKDVPPVPCGIKCSVLPWKTDRLTISD